MACHSCRAIDLERKYNAIHEVKKGTQTKKAIADLYKVPPNTLSTWLKTQDKIIEAYEQQKFGPKRLRLRKAKHEQLDDAVDVWLREKRSRNVAIGGDHLRAAARDLAAEMDLDDFKASKGWMDGFKNRKGLTFRYIQGEAKSVNLETVDAWKSTILTKLLEDYEPDCIYNADETGLFWKMQAKRSLIYKAEDGRGGKQSKERVTLLLAANMSGTDKLKPLVVNKSKNPRAFGRRRSKAANLPVDWEANPSAWMTTEIFTRWLMNLDRRFSSMGKKVALVLDNASCHPATLQRLLKSIKLVFIPPNTTSVIQPMDQGIIANFKRKFQGVYLKSLCRPDSSWIILDVCVAIKQAWGMVTPVTVANSFRHCGFIHYSIPPGEPDEDEIPLAELMRRVHPEVTEDAM